MTTDRLGKSSGKDRPKLVAGKADWPDPYAGRQISDMTPDDWCARGNAYLDHIGRAHECHWVVRNGQPTIELWSALA